VTLLLVEVVVLTEAKERRTVDGREATVEEDTGVFFGDAGFSRYT
jgi:hypothetical protein